jgi:cbb3-type cytochrome oxidase cytochrome c subunit
MNHGALFFLAGFLALASSWCGLVLAPQLQVGRQQLAANPVDNSLYPSRRPGLAEQGAQVYRANGCVTCHSQQVRQTGTVFDVVLNEAGTNQPALIEALKTINSKLDAAALAALPKDALRGVDKPAADAADDALKKSGAKYSVNIRPIGPDMDRGWGRRASVAQDYLWDAPAFPGSQRLGPDLANIGVRQPDANWHLKHLYAPESVVKGSTMPPYRFLFEKRKIARQPSASALQLDGEFAPESGFEIVPTEQAVALVEYLKSLRADAPLYEAPLSVK